jgi:hypothetical protein
VHIERVVRAGLRAGFAADTAARIEIYYPIRAREKRGYGTDFDARRVGTVIASHYRKKPARVGKLAFFDVFYPSSIDADRNFVFRFARYCAGVAADTLPVINNKTIVHKLFVLPTIIYCYLAFETYFFGMPNELR